MYNTLYAKHGEALKNKQNYKLISFSAKTNDSVSVSPPQLLLLVLCLILYILCFVKPFKFKVELSFIV